MARFVLAVVLVACAAAGRDEEYEHVAYEFEVSPPVNSAHEAYAHVAYRVFEDEATVDGSTEENNPTTTRAPVPATTPPPTTAATTATTTPPPTTAAVALSLASAVITVAVMPGLGSVKVFFNAIPLGVPSFESESAFNPVEGVHIIVPAGAWTRGGRRDGGDVLTLTVFELPAGLVTPGIPCGPAIDLGPRAKVLAKAITVSTPCDVGRVYSLDVASMVWAADNTTAEAGAWARTTSMGVHSAMTERAPEGFYADASRVAAIVGGVVAGVAVVVFIAVLCARRRAGKVEEEEESVVGQLSFIVQREC